MASPLATRLWRVCKESNRPWPQLDPDDVVDYLIMEAVTVKANKEDETARKTAEREKWKKDTSKLEEFR